MVCCVGPATQALFLTKKEQEDSCYLLLLQKIDWREPLTIDSFFPIGVFAHHKKNQSNQRKDE
jgi:hypothetical protein